MNTTSKTFDKWIDTLIDEKGIDIYDSFEIDNNIIEYGVVIEHIKITSREEQKQIKNILVTIDFRNGDIKHFLRHLAQAIVMEVV